MKRAWLDLWVGLFVAAGIGALLILALKVGNLSSFDSGHGYAVMAEFDDVGGLKERAPVKSSGVVVGRVADIQFDDKAYEARVTLRIDSAYKFPRDTSAAIMTSGLLGEQYVALEAGGDPVMLADGDSITLTQSAIVLENLIGQLLFDKAQEGESKEK
jgi:phospholipid/cholesterol/gamma-HCH transport system substrate-binding protein